MTTANFGRRSAVRTGFNRMASMRDGQARSADCPEMPLDFDCFWSFAGNKIPINWRRISVSDISDR